jgi:hypothetical protein
MNTTIYILLYRSLPSNGKGRGCILILFHYLYTRQVCPFQYWPCYYYSFYNILCYGDNLLNEPVHMHSAMIKIIHKNIVGLMCSKLGHYRSIKISLKNPTKVTESHASLNYLSSAGVCTHINISPVMCTLPYVGHINKLVLMEAGRLIDFMTL